MSGSRSALSARRFIAFVLVGVIGGLMAGLFGVGGGLFMVPLLIWLAGFDQRRAAATSLAAIIPTALAAGVGYLVRGEVDFLVAAIVAIGGIAGSLIGSRLLTRLPLGWLRWLFIAFMVVAAARLVLEAPARGGAFDPSIASISGLIGLGLAMGIAGGLFGIGGGIIAVPAFIALFGMGDLLAKGTSLFAMIPAAITGTVANLRNGLVHWAEATIIGLNAVGATFAGVALAFRLDPRIASIAFAALVLAACVQLAWRAIAQRR